MDEEDETRKKKLEEYRRMQESAKAEEQLKSALRVVLDDAAYERMMNISYANKELYVNAAQRLLMAFKGTGRKITEDEVLFLIRSLKGERETKITFREK
jgi:DNA-binding TFAR19-related protein (PDSD5 family)